MQNGVLLLDKPERMTSHDLVQKVRRIFKQKKVGHCGTLDPSAEGLMVLTLGKACKLSQYLAAGDKTYDLTVQLGLVTDTLDREGRILKHISVREEPQKIRQAVQKCLGDLCLPIPQFSAKKFQGRKLYEYARSGKPVPIIKKDMYFYNLKIHSVSSDQVSCRLSCSKGSYIRAWAKYLGEKLETGGCLIRLKRIESQPYHLNQSILLHDLLAFSDHLEKLSSCWIPFEKCLSDLNKNSYIACKK